MRTLLVVLSFLMTSTLWADPPMKVVYQKTSSAGFAWYWPYKTWHKTTSVETHPAASGSGYRTVAYYPTYDDLSVYRFHNPQLTYHNKWGYFFPAGTRPVRVGSGSALLVPSLH